MPYVNVWVDPAGSPKGGKGGGKGKNSGGKGGKTGKAGYESSGKQPASPKKKVWIYCKNPKCPEFMGRAKAYFGPSPPELCNFCGTKFQWPSNRGRPEARTQPTARASSGNSQRDLVTALVEGFSTIAPDKAADISTMCSKLGVTPAKAKTPEHSAWDAYRKADLAAKDAKNRLVQQEAKLDRLLKEAEEAATKVDDIKFEVAETEKFAEQLRAAHQSELGRPEQLSKVIRHRAHEHSAAVGNIFAELDNFGVQHGISPDMQTQLQALFAKVIDVVDTTEGEAADEHGLDTSPNSAFPDNDMERGEEHTFGPAPGAPSSTQRDSPYAPDRESSTPTDRRGRLANLLASRR